ncbi:bifunctional DNA primase/polymerase [Streptomyces sp. NBC_01221]|uniref:bifunctional DNA primase/polymerase n=1 Tax=Streptomyces sp. NBC_01221 TaxID=2903782 RepID=UPI0022573A35|nr:bifunctional DNA primase/polymerase [Streptomyces sp. NBC_01221]MCX4787664.1 bifunctional DNA primase/polymerase [Streptomyces sp. NBC_01221]
MHHNTPPPAILQSAEQGWHVFPLIPGDKRPAVRSWESRATTDLDRLALCWSAGPYNVGIATGPSRLVVVDLDVPKGDQDRPPVGIPEGVTDGADALGLLAEEHGERYPSDTYTVRTASGGLHLYFTAPPGTELRNTAGKLSWKIDTRANGGYVVGAGSTVHGQTYEVVHEAPLAPLPAWLVKLLVPAPLPPQSPLSVPLHVDDRHDAYLKAAVDGERRRVTQARAGSRNNSLYQASVALGQLVAGQELTADYVASQLVDAALRIDLGEGDARRTVASGLRAGARKPRTVARRSA